MLTSRKQLPRRPLFAGHRPEKGLHGEIDRHGNEVWYFREGHGPRTRIDGAFGSPKFVEAYKAAKWGRPGPFQCAAPKKALTHTDSGSLAWLIDQFMSSSAWAATAPATQKQRRNILAHVAKENGAYAVRDLDSAWVAGVQELAAGKGATAMANAVVKVLRCLFDWAVPKHMPVNIAKGVELIKRDDEDGFHSWEESELAKFEACYPVGTRERLAYAVLLWTGQRRGDAVKLGEQHVRDGVLRIKQEKCGIKVAIPVMPELAEALAAGPKGDLCWIVGDKGLPITKDSFTGWFRKVCDAAGLKECSAHGLRKAAARRFAERGATLDELKAWFGWSENRTPGIYTRAADNELLAANAARRMKAA